MRSLRTCFELNGKSHEEQDDKHPIFQSQVRDHSQTHAGLWHDKFLVEQESSDDAARQNSEVAADASTKKKSSRTTLVEEVATLPLPHAYETFYKHWQEMLAGYAAITYTAKVKERMIVGLGSESVLETNIALHHTYGVPYIPGSALKGLTASYIGHKLAKLRPAEEETQAYKQLRAAHRVLFGDTDETGYIIFLDAFYIPGTGYNEQALYPDIITVHHQGYYQGNAATAPADWDSPIPVPFLSATGAYLIALAAPDIQPDQRTIWINTTASILAEALASMGIGAKTSSGYGRMQIELPEGQPEVQPHKVAAAPIDEEARKIESYIKEVRALPDHPSIFSQMQSPHYQRWQAVNTHARSRELASAIVEKFSTPDLQNQQTRKRGMQNC